VQLILFIAGQVRNMKIEIRQPVVIFVLTVCLVVGSFFLGRADFRKDMTYLYQRFGEECGLPDEPVKEWQEGLCINGLGVDQINVLLFGIEH
jgi:hypothetical protein